MVAMLSKDGMDLYQMIQGSHTGQSFAQFLRLVIAHLDKTVTYGNAIIILDNCAVHKVEEIRELVDWIDPATWDPRACTANKKVRMLFLPAYSPFLNPIEEVFGWIKRNVKQHRPIDAEDLFNLIQLCSRALQPSMTQKFYQHANSYLGDCRLSKPIK
jgi:transposase